MKYALGMDVGGTRTKLGLAELETGMVKDTIVYPTEKKEIDFLQLLSYHVEELTHSVNKSDIIGIGAAISGYIHRDTRRIDEASGNFIPFFASYPIERKLEKLLGMPCKAENDAAIVCYGEALYGAGKDYERVLMLTLGTGVGVGFVAHKKMSEETSMIHKAGHIKVSDSCTGADRRCYCGIKGCLESVCSGTALSREASVRYGCSMTNEELFQRAEGKEETAKKLIEEYLDALASGLNQYIYLFAPDVIVLGGGVSNALEGYVEGLKERITAAVYSGHEVHIRLSELRENAGILGSAALLR